jgi:hypothetical protein
MEETTELDSRDKESKMLLPRTTVKKIRLPLPLAILLISVILALISLLGEGMSRGSSLAKAPQLTQTVDEPQAAAVYFRVMSWLSRILPGPVAVPKITNPGPPSTAAGKTSVVGKSAPEPQPCPFET